MKKRFCINIDKCIVLPLTFPIFWSIFLLFIFLLTFFISLAKGETVTLFESINNSWAFWFYLSSPISFIIFALISFGFILFPISYVEVCDKYIRIHRAFKKEIIVYYDEIFYVRFKKNRKKDWALVFFALYAGGEINTIEIRKDYPHPHFWFSSSWWAYDLISQKFKNACFGNEDLTEGDSFVAESQWFIENGSPVDIKWDGHYGIY